jgi:tripartite-type tricarboxylate transporter receptor subunit TctC
MRIRIRAGVPTVAESGCIRFQVTNWHAFVALGRTPPEILEYWNREIVKAPTDPQVSAELGEQGPEPASGTRDERALRRA